MKLFALKERSVKKALFLDRDGTINQDRPGVYITSEKALKIYPSAIKALKKISASGEYRLIVLTNQSAVGRKLMTEKKSRQINRLLVKKLSQAGIKISGLYYCPHSPETGCSCRKPKPGLIKEALKDFPTDISGSFVAGDKKSDMELAERTGMRGIFLLTGQGKSQLKKHKIRYNFKVKDLRSLRKIL